MINFLKKKFIDLMISRGHYIEKATDKTSVENLIRSLRPYKVDKELVRLGPDKDGGYLVPDDLENIYACFSPGVGRMSEFELHCLDYGMKLYLADKSVDGPGTADPRLQFLKKFVGPINDQHFITLDRWVESTIQGDDDDLMLQMDIEGYEYLTLVNASEALLKRFRIVVVEFHNLHKFWDREFFKLANATFEKLLQHHVCVHIHPNNVSGEDVRYGVRIPRAAEFTFYRADRVRDKAPQTVLPHPLDCDNTPFPSLPLPTFWYAD